MKSKRLMALFLSAFMAIGLLAGCGSSDGSDAPAGSVAAENENAASEDAEGGNAASEDAESGNAASENAEGENAASGDNGEIYNIDMQIVTWGDVPSEIADVEAAINAITEPEIGVTVTLNPIAAWDLINESNMTVTSGEKLDLLCIFAYGQAMDSIINYTAKNMLRPLDELYKTYGGDIGSVLGEEINLGYVGSTLYAIPCKAPLGMSAGVSVRKDYMDELGIEVDPEKIYTVEELEEVFQAYVDHFGAGHYPLALFGAGTDIYQYLYPVETLGGTGNNGVLLNGGLDGNTTVVNLFETDSYKEYCEIVHRWFEKGFINPDVNTISDDVTSQIKSGNYLGMIGSNYPGSLVGITNSVGVEFQTMMTIEPYASTKAASQALWAIPTTCENPEKTMQFLNLLYQDRALEKDIDALISCGLNGVSYDLVEELSGSKAIISPGSGTWSMWVPDFLYGNYYTTPKFTPNEAGIFDEMEAFDQQIIADGRITDAFGYVFDSSSVSAQVAAVTSVNSQYRGLVGYGAADPEEVLPEYIAALKDAGIDDIIAENQRQLDEWLSSR